MKRTMFLSVIFSLIASLTLTAQGNPKPAVTDESIQRHCSQAPNEYNCKVETRNALKKAQKENPKQSQNPIKQLSDGIGKGAKAVTSGAKAAVKAVTP